MTIQSESIFSTGSGSSARPSPRCARRLLHTVAALVTAVEELEVGDRVLSIPRGATSLLLVRLLSLHGVALRCLVELDRLREAADIDSTRPRWAVETLEACWGLDRLVRYPQVRERDELFGTLRPSASAMLGLAEDRLRRGEGDGETLRRLLGRLRAVVRETRRVDREEACDGGLARLAAVGLAELRGPFRVWIEVEAGSPASTSQLAELLADHQRARTGAGAVSGLAKDPLA